MAGKRGGPRPNSGRKIGSITRATREAYEKAKATGELPVDYMLRVMRDTTAPDARRDAMASAAAPYLHHRLAAIEYSGPAGGPVEVEVSDADLARKIAFLLAKAAKKVA